MLHIVKISLLSMGILFLTSQLKAQQAWNQTFVCDTNNSITDFVAPVHASIGQMTMEFWIRPTAFRTTLSNIGDGFSGIMLSNGSLFVNTGGSRIITNIQIPVNQWTHIAITYDTINNPIKKDTVQLFINGMLDKVYAFDFKSSVKGLIGDSLKIKDFMGEVDELRYWNRVLTDAEIFRNRFSHYASYGHGVAGLIYSQSFDAPQFDKNKNFSVGNKVGVVKTNLLGDKPSEIIRSNQSLKFDGSIFYRPITVNDSSVLMAGPLTIELWVKPTGTGNSTIFSRQSVIGVEDLGISILNTFNLGIFINGSIGGNAKIDLNHWNHITLVIDSPIAGMNLATLYVNGKKNVSFQANKLNRSTGKINLGTNTFTGFMDELRISNFAKSEAEIMAGMHIPTYINNQLSAPKHTVAYNFDGTLRAGTSKGFPLFPVALTASYNNKFEIAAPLFYPNESLNSFHIKNAFKPFQFSVAESFEDSLYISDSVIIDPDKFSTFIAFDHTRMNDAMIELIAPSGQLVRLLQSTTCPVTSLVSILDSQRQISMLNSTTLVDFSPSIGSNQTYIKFAGVQTKGWWRLLVNDAGLSKPGELYSWGVNFNSKSAGVRIQHIENSTDDFKSILYPNPAIDEIFITSNHLIKTLKVYNMEGKTLLYSMPNQTSIHIDMHTYQQGIYIIEMIDEKGKSHKEKIIKN